MIISLNSLLSQFSVVGASPIHIMSSLFAEHLQAPEITVSPHYSFCLHSFNSSVEILTDILIDIDN